MSMSGDRRFVFFVSAAVFGFEIFCSVVMSFLFGSEYSFVVIGIAMLGLAVAGTAISVAGPGHAAPFDPRTAGRLCAAMAASVVAVLLFAAMLKDSSNAGIGKALAEGGLPAAVRAQMSASMAGAPLVGVLMAVPFFLFAFILNRMFMSAGAIGIARLYAAELAGGALGCVAVALLLDLLGFAHCLAAIVSVMCVCAADRLLGERAGWRGAATLFFVGAVAFALLFFASRRLEPRPQLDLLARNYDLSREVREVWSDWTTYSRVSALRVSGGRSPRVVMALGNGEGHAGVAVYRKDGPAPRRHLASTTLGMAAKNPENVLLLFAGAGADMITLRQAAGGRARITGVELNRKLFQAALRMPEANLQEFFSLPGVRMRIQEARAFLERSRERYDLIVLSWSGATVAYYTGAIGHTAQFMYTKEAMRALLDHLTPDGTISVMNTNKVNLLASLREVFDERRLPGLAQAVFVLYTPGSETSDWRNSWDENRVLIKPAGFSPDDQRRVRKAAASLGLSVAYSPAGDGPAEFWPYSAVLVSADLGGALARINTEANLKLGVSVDDRPYTFFVQRPRDYLSARTWREMARDVGRGAGSLWYREFFIVLLTLAALVGVAIPLVRSSRIELTARTAAALVYFLATGFGFMFVEVGLVHVFSLVLETPGVTIAVAVGGIVASTGLGSALSERVFRGRAPVPWIVVALAAYVLCLLQVHAWLAPAVLTWPLPVKGLYCFALIVPAGILMGQLFPQGLAAVGARNKALIPWAWAVNGAAGTVVGLCSPLLAQHLGFAFLVKAGAVAYASILLVYSFVFPRS